MILPGSLGNGLKGIVKPVIVAHISCPRTREAEAGGSLQVQGQPGLCRILGQAGLQKQTFWGEGGKTLSLGTTKLCSPGPLVSSRFSTPTTASTSQRTNQ